MTKAKLDPKHPIENWRFEVRINDAYALSHLATSIKGPLGLKRTLVIFGKALANCHKHLECPSYALLEDGSLIVRQAIDSLPSSVLAIDIMDAFNLGSLAGLSAVKSELETHKISHPYRIAAGFLKTNESHSELLMMDESGDFYFHDRRESWKACQVFRGREVAA